ncbi:MAG: hypothetical protein Q7R75_01415 [bacterium]|nr:hypothetical protein [bacterium]
MNFKNLLQTKKLTVILCVVGIIIAAILVFQAGVFVGYRKAAFSYKWGENYYRVFGERKRGPLMGVMGEDFPNAHGATGKIIKIDLPTFIIAGQDKIEKIVLIKDDTAIRRFRETIKPADIKVDDFAVVIGSPNGQAQIEAKFIRLMPAPLQ